MYERFALDASEFDHTICCLNIQRSKKKNKFTRVFFYRNGFVAVVFSLQLSRCMMLEIGEGRREAIDAFFSSGTGFPIHYFSLSIFSNPPLTRFCLSFPAQYTHRNMDIGTAFSV